MPTIVLTPAKINLCLEVLGKRPDGYHEIKTVMQTVTWFDRLGVEATHGPDSLKVRGPAAKSVPTDDSNLVLRATELLRNHTGIKRGAKIILEKSIPAGAGLGGGSSNAAATLSILNDLWGTGLAKSELEKIGAGIGSDVPFFLTGGRALAEGRGEIITNLPQTSRRSYFVLLVPPIVISTAEVYKKLQRDLTPNVKSDKLGISRGRNKRGATKSQPPELSRLFGHNDLRSAAFQLSPELADVWRGFDKVPFGVKGMSGSGSSFFGICKTHLDAATRAKELRLAGLGRVAVLAEFAAPFLAVSTAGGLLRKGVLP